MNKLLDKFRTHPCALNRKNLAGYLRRHPMALCFASIDDVRFLRDNGFI
jgi:hypothetical protein